MNRIDNCRGIVIQLIDKLGTSLRVGDRSDAVLLGEVLSVRLQFKIGGRPVFVAYHFQMLCRWWRYRLRLLFRRSVGGDIRRFWRRRNGFVRLLGLVAGIREISC